jgi:8-oxo-dGTP pyrophosphatase MutT (NUDIX family)
MCQPGEPVPLSEYSLVNALDAYLSQHPDEAPVVARFRALLQDHPNCFERSCWAGHITGSAWLVDPSGDEVLLTHHRKLNAWFQLGGHSDGDTDTLSVAQREGEEESGLRLLPVQRQIFDIDVHEIPARKQDPAHWHFDVRFAFVSTSGRDYRVSAESLDLAWVPIQQLERFTTERSMLRMADKWHQWRSEGRFSEQMGVM